MAEARDWSRYSDIHVVPRTAHRLADDEKTNNVDQTNRRSTDTEGLQNDTSKDGSNEREHHHREQQLRLMNGFHPELTKHRAASD